MPPHRLSRLLARVLLTAALPCGAVSAQCPPNWSGMGSGMRGQVPFAWELATLNNGDVVAAGTFSTAGGMPAESVARWDGGSWWPLGSGVGPYPRSAVALAVMANGDLIVGGNFQTAGSIAAHGIARWDGASWHALGSGASGCIGCSVGAVLTMPNGDVIAGGGFTSIGGTNANRIARWNGTSWSALGTGFASYVQDLAVMPNGDIVAGGSFFQSGTTIVNRIARWNGANWSPLGGGIGGAFVSRLLVLANGDLLVGGNFSTAGGSPANNVAIWDGQTWTSLGTGLNDQVRALLQLPNGDLLVGGYFTMAGSVAVNHVARWNGASWSAAGPGVSGGQITCVHDLTRSADTVVLCGDFTAAGGTGANYVARMTTPCPASASSYGTSCIGTVGPATLSATAMPWIGSTFRATTAGLAPNSLAVGVFGFRQIAVPLSSGNPLALPGCDVLVADEILIEFLAGNGSVHSSIAIPNDTNLIGGAFHHQVVPVELDASGEIAALTTSNALTLTVGAF